MVKSHIASKEQLISNKDKYYFIFLAGLFLVLMSYLGAAWADNASLGKTQQEKEEYRERVRRWEQLEPKKRAAILKNFEQYRKLSSEEKQRIQENWQKWKQLPPEEKKEIRAREKQWKKLNPEQKRKLRERKRDDIQQHRDRREDIRDRGEDRREDIRDRKEDRHDRREDIKERREDSRDRKEDVGDRGEDSSGRDRNVKPGAALQHKKGSPEAGYDMGLHKGWNQGVRDHGKGIGKGKGQGPTHRKRDAEPRDGGNNPVD